MKYDNFKLNKSAHGFSIQTPDQHAIGSNKPARRSNPIPTHPEEDDDEPVRPGKTDPAKKKKKKSIYEVTF